MYHTRDKATIFSCANTFLQLIDAKMSPDLGAVFIVRIAVSAFTCSLIILLNILVIVGAKTNRQLHSSSVPV